MRPPENIILLDRIEPGVTPPYCTHGRTPCIACDEWCWLGHATHDVVASGQAVPLCIDCGHRFIPRDHPVAGHVVDHLRKDGPHT